MREFKGDWKDLFSGFMIALDIRKMLFAFSGLLFTVVLLGLVTFAWQYFVIPEGNENVCTSDDSGARVIRLPETLAPNAIYAWFKDRLCGFSEFQTQPKAEGKSKTFVPKNVRHPGICEFGLRYKVPYLLIAAIVLGLIWSYFGGAIARSAACEIAREGERIETPKALHYAGQKFWSYFGAPLICILGFLFFFLCNFVAGFVFYWIDKASIGAPLAALLLPLALLSGFVMTLIVIGTLAGFPLFFPAVAAEGTDAFDAFSRGFSYVYSKPWHYLWYQGVSAVYGYVCTAFVILFTVFMCHVGLKAGGTGFDLISRIKGEKREFRQVSEYAWTWVLSRDHAGIHYSKSPERMLKDPHPMGWILKASDKIVHPDFDTPLPDTKLHKYASVIIIAWLFVVLGLAYSFAVSYFISQQTMIYFILRKKVDEIEVKEIYYEEDQEQKAEPVAGEVKVEKPQDPQQPPAGEKKPG